MSRLVQPVSSRFQHDHSQKIPDEIEVIVRWVTAANFLDSFEQSGRFIVHRR
ncbi:hypothetical protein LPU83_pLPU83c_0630 (plasmid) [Rhizobium favelukesii]|uniref:Uncharacterized protein n=1 Tax=Rhizobium favelukesii TaxID=348824 RepID=W6RJ59_9HYPH|nr:hypothetical protein LPU83_pLPU83c_0630 [Rhizobium favelukesii]